MVASSNHRQRPLRHRAGSDFINAFLLVELAFEAGYLVDFIGVERSRSNTDAGNPQGDEEQPLFHLSSCSLLEVSATSGTHLHGSPPLLQSVEYGVLREQLRAC